MKKRTCENLPPDSEEQEKKTNRLKRMNRRQPDSTKRSLDGTHRSPSERLRCELIRLHFTPPPFLCTLLELHRTTGTLKAEPFGQFVPQQFERGGGAPLPTAQPAHSHSACSVIRCDTKTSLSSSLCQPATPHWKPDLTAMTLQPDWTSDPLTSPSHSYGAQAPLPLLKCRPLDYSINTLPWSQRFFPLASVPASVSNPAPTRKHLLIIFFCIFSPLYNISMFRQTFNVFVGLLGGCWGLY